MYPVMLNVEGRKVVVVGGGYVATKKIHNLVKEKASITVISPAVTAELEQYNLSGAIQWVQRPFQPTDTKNAFLVFAATDDPQTNENVKRSCEEGQLLNVLSEQDQSDFYNTAYLERGPLKISVSTEGASPLLTKQIIKELNALFEGDYGDYLKFLSEARERIKETVNDEDRKRYLLEDVLREDYRKNEVERELFLHRLS